MRGRASAIPRPLTARFSILNQGVATRASIAAGTHTMSLVFWTAGERNGGR